MGGDELDCQVVFLPSFIRSSFVYVGIESVKVSDLYVGLLSMNEVTAIKYVSIFDTPHFAYACHVLHNQKLSSKFTYLDYLRYKELHSQSHSEAGFNSLIYSMLKGGYDWQTRPVLVFRNWRRLYPFHRRDVADGFHRLAILAAMGEENIKVGLLHHKYSVIERAKRRLLGG